MSSLINGMRRLRFHSQLAAAQSHLRSPLGAIRRLNTDSVSSTDAGADGGADGGIDAVAAAAPSTQIVKIAEAIESVRIPFQNVTHARAVPQSPSYFSREPGINDLYIRLKKLLTKYHHLPTLTPTQAPAITWIKRDELEQKFAEHIRAAHYAKVLRVAKRLNMIEPTVVPEDVKIAIESFSRVINPTTNVAKVQELDLSGRALGVGRRKESSAQAYVVEGTGKVLINGKPLNEAFGRVHDRESAVWALQATHRLDKYNVWARVRGGGTTGQAEALTLAVAKALIAHEPALKTALKKAGCITRDRRTVERKKHGHVKARKMPAWVKR